MGEDGYIVVTLKNPLPGVRHTVFVFNSYVEAEEFASCVHAKFENAETHTEYSGLPTDVFESWSM